MAITDMDEIGLIMALLSLLIWLVLLFGRGQFWRADQFLPDDRRGTAAPETQKPALPADVTNPTDATQIDWPTLCAVIPARNEADLLPVTLRSLLMQDYPGSFRIVLVDDQSTDGTAAVAQQLAASVQQTTRLEVITTASLPAGWTGKLWAMEQGVRHAQTLTPPPDYFLFTDADIQHNASNLTQLVTKAQGDDRDLVSLMVLLRCQSRWETLLIPAFVFFFQKLYPFRWANNPNRKLAAAAGGCILMRRDALTRIGGLQMLRQALIDDCTLAAAVKATATAPNKIWLGLTYQAYSLRPYPSLKSIWDMVARTAFSQLNYSPLLLIGTLVGMTLVYLVPPISTIVGLLTGHRVIAAIGLLTWLLMAIAYLPTLRLYQRSPLLAFGLPAIAVLYNLMTLDSALRHWRGQGGAWKGRVYPSET